MTWGACGFWSSFYLSSILTTFVCFAVVVLRIIGSRSLNCSIDSWTAAWLEAVLAGVSAAGLGPEADTRLSRAFIFQIHFFSEISRKVSTDIFYKIVDSDLSLLGRVNTNCLSMQCLPNKFHGDKIILKRPSYIDCENYNHTVVCGNYNHI